MCFNTRSMDEKATIAKKDILAYKLLKNVTATGATSPFQDHQKWEVGKAVKVPLKAKLRYRGQQIEEGLHCFKTQSGAMNYDHRENAHVLVPVMIPKGARYYENATQFVSNQLIVLGTNLPAFKRVMKLTGSKKF